MPLPRPLLAAAAACLVLLACQPAPRAQPAARAQALTVEAVNAAGRPELGARSGQRGRGADAGILRLQVLLDRGGASPGVIDGRDGDNVRKAVRAFREMRELPAGDAVDEAMWTRLTERDDPALVRHRITAEDLRGPFAPDLSEDYAELARRREIPFRTPREMFAERFHMHEDLLQVLNPDAAFDRAGVEIVVADPGRRRARAGQRLGRILVDREGAVRALDENRVLVAFYPATVGSRRTPSPTGTHRVTAIARNPTYFYDPDTNFVQGNNRERLRLPAGPNNPVGTVWIDLSEPTYGIHGTPEPSEIDKTSSHGCVRLTNWDAEELAGLVHVGLTVEFVR